MIPRFWAENGKVCSRFMEPMTEEEAVFHLEQVEWLALNDRKTPDTFITRWGDLVRAIREAKAQEVLAPVTLKDAA